MVRDMFQLVGIRGNYDAMIHDKEIPQVAEYCAKERCDENDLAQLRQFIDE